MKCKCSETALPAAYAKKEEGNGNEVTFVPHILSILSYPLLTGHAAHTERLHEKKSEKVRGGGERR